MHRPHRLQRPHRKPRTGPIQSIVAYIYDIRRKTYIPYVVNTNSARQVEFAERELS